MYDIACFNINGEMITHLTQWDIGQKIVFKDIELPELPYVHFCNRNSKKALVVKPTSTNDNGLIVEVPNSLLREPYSIVAYVCEHDDDNVDSATVVNTLYTIRIPIKKRPQPEGYIYDEDKNIITITKINNQIIEILNTLDHKQDIYSYTIDLTAPTYDQNTWYPVTGASGIPRGSMHLIQVSASFDTCHPSWATNIGGYSCNMEIHDKAQEWGQVNSATYCTDYSWKYAGELAPCGYTQMYSASIPVVTLRGGGVYTIVTDFEEEWLVRTEVYVINSDTVRPINKPTFSINRSSIYANLNGDVTGNADSATCLQNIRYLEGREFNGTGDIHHYGVCSTAGDRAAKTVSIEGIQLKYGARVQVEFTNTNTATDATLDVNGTGAKPIYFQGSPVRHGTITQNMVLTFIYDGYYWQIADGLIMPRLIDGVLFNGAKDITHYGEVFPLGEEDPAYLYGYLDNAEIIYEKGARVSLLFPFNVVANSTIDIGATSRKAIYYKGEPIQDGCIKAGMTVDMVYDGEHWAVVGDLPQKQLDLLTASVADAKSKIDNLKIGGRNLLCGSEIGDISLPLFDGSNAVLSGLPYLDGAPLYSMSGPAYIKVNFPILNTGDVYTFSCDVARQSGGSAKNVIFTVNGENINVGTAVEGTWTNFSVTFTAKADSTNILIRVGSIDVSDTGWLGHTRHFKLEKGNKTTDWTPAPEDKADTEHKHDDYVEKTNAEITGSISQYRKPGSYVGNMSCALGDGCEASGNVSHAEGDGTTASGVSSHAEGGNTKASGVSSHAEGDCSEATGHYSHAEGSYTKASGKGSHAEGEQTIAKGDSQHVQGKFNVEDTENKYAHIVGNGVSTSERSNAHTLDWDGNGWFAGKLSQEGTPTTDKDLATKKYVDDLKSGFYGVCDTASSQAEKTVTIPGITTLKTGIRIDVEFKNQNRGGNPTLNVNNLGAKPIKYAGSYNYLRPTITSGSILSMVYSGTTWEVVSNPDEMHVIKYNLDNKIKDITAIKCIPVTNSADNSTITAWAQEGYEKEWSVDASSGYYIDAYIAEEGETVIVRCTDSTTGSKCYITVTITGSRGLDSFLGISHGFFDGEKVLTGSSSSSSDGGSSSKILWRGGLLHGGTVEFNVPEECWHNNHTQLTLVIESFLKIYSAGSDYGTVPMFVTISIGDHNDFGISSAEGSGYEDYYRPYINGVYASSTLYRYINETWLTSSWTPQSITLSIKAKKVADSRYAICTVSSDAYNSSSDVVITNISAYIPKELQ